MDRSPGTGDAVRDTSGLGRSIHADEGPARAVLGGVALVLRRTASCGGSTPSRARGLALLARRFRKPATVARRPARPAVGE